MVMFSRINYTPISFCSKTAIEFYAKQMDKLQYCA